MTLEYRNASLAQLKEIQYLRDNSSAFRELERKVEARGFVAIEFYDATAPQSRYVAQPLFREPV